jgi:translation initiation factor IF-2
VAGLLSGTIQQRGRYHGKGGSTNGKPGGGSTELSFSNTDARDSNDEPFLIGSGGGQGGDRVGGNFGGGGGRGGVSNGGNGEGNPPPQGGGNPTAADGDGAIDDLNRGLVSGGSTIQGGGSGPATDGEARVTYNSTGPTTPSAPSGLSLTVL